jgi:hypothetical protein
MRARKLAPALCGSLLAFLLPGSAALAAAASPAGSGGCSPDDQALGHCFSASTGFVVEIVTGPSGEFPEITAEGDSKFAYRITGPGGGPGCRDVSHAAIQIPVCGILPMDLLWASGKHELLTNGHGDPSCGFGSGNQLVDVLKWEQEVACDGSLVIEAVFRGLLGAELQEFQLKNGPDCHAGTILGPSCPIETGTRYCEGEACPCGNNATSGGCRNSSGFGGLIAAAGSTSILADDLAIYASHLVPNQPALLFAGDAALNGGGGRLFGDGLRCVGVNVARLQVGIPDAGGNLVYGPGVIGMDHLAVAGAVRHMQVWYRDPNAGPCGSGFNLTNALVLTYAN